MTVQFHDVKDTRRTTQLQGQSALSACAEEPEEEPEEEQAEEQDEAVEHTAVFMSIDDHKAASAQERLQQSVEEADSDDPFGFAPEEGEQEQRTSTRRSSHRQSMCFRPSCGRGRGSSGELSVDDTDERMGAEGSATSEAASSSSFTYRPSCGGVGGTALGLFVEEVDESNLSSSSEERSRTSSLLAEQE